MDGPPASEDLAMGIYPTSSCSAEAFAQEAWDEDYPEDAEVGEEVGVANPEALSGVVV